MRKSETNTILTSNKQQRTDFPIWISRIDVHSGARKGVTIRKSLGLGVAMYDRPPIRHV